MLHSHNCPFSLKFSFSFFWLNAHLCLVKYTFRYIFCDTYLIWSHTNSVMCKALACHTAQQRVGGNSASGDGEENYLGGCYMYGDR